MFNDDFENIQTGCVHISLDSFSKFLKRLEDVNSALENLVLFILLLRIFHLSFFLSML